MKKKFVIGTFFSLFFIVIAVLQNSDGNTAHNNDDTTLTYSKPQYTEYSATTLATLPSQVNRTNAPICESLEQLRNELATTRARMLEAETLLYDSLAQADISIKGKNALYSAAGFPVSNFRTKRVGFAPNNLVNFAFNSQPQPVMPPASYQLTLALAKSSNLDIIQMLKNGKLTQNSTFDGWNILSTIMLHSQLDPSTLQQIGSAGIKVTLTDLVFATLTKQNELVLDALAQSYQGDLNTLFQANGKFYNLVTLSTEMLHYPALKLWSSHGVRHNIVPDFYSSLDILPVPVNEHEQAQALAILDFLVKYGVQANYPHTLSRIHQWTNRQYQDLLQLSDSFEQLTGDSRIPKEQVQFLEQVRQTQSVYYALLDRLSVQQHNCGEFDISLYALFDEEGHKNMQDWLSSLPRMNKMSEEEIFALTLALDTQKTVDAGDYDSVVALLEKYGSLGGAHPEFDQLLFISMLSHHADVDQLVQMSQLAQIPDNAVFMLIAQQRIDEIVKLIPYGLNVEITNNVGQTPLQFASEIGLDFGKMMQLSETLNLATIK
ncbi:hypothetical protein HRH59_13585 [Rheinheimera sp. YQF-2]|uniref:Ankyrin repeat domain-containing protein n=1 Tax=Rheinheimera lutimaris TaxID=2740584 RepID=A0A7Y5ATA2_9GAMM|nr:hypothetical protein [Rheinheimera lutimaris]NRQ43580.1 hypothetical protein [Rheinheimera lutimaris]